MLRISTIVGAALVGFGMLGLAFVSFSDSARMKITAAFQAPAPNRGLPVNPASGGAMLVSGAILLFSGKNRIS